MSLQGLMILTGPRYTQYSWLLDQHLRAPSQGIKSPRPICASAELCRIHCFAVARTDWFAWLAECDRAGGEFASGVSDGASAADEQTSSSAPDSPAPAAATLPRTPSPPATTTRADRNHVAWLRGAILGLHAATTATTTRTLPALPLRHLHVDAQRLRLRLPARQGGRQQLSGHAALQ